MKIATSLIFFMLPSIVLSQQVADTSYNPVIKNPAYQSGKGPVIFIDEGHHNFHTKNGRYQPFAKLLERDGYTVAAYQDNFQREKLAKGKILVISNALNEINVENWYLPTPSAFTTDEIAVVKLWVQEGGNLFLIADHMPMAGAATDLATAFGFEFSNGFVIHHETKGNAYFNLKDGSLAECMITKGRNPDESIGQVVSFTGQGFKIPADAVSILTFGGNYENLLPDTAWVFTENTKKTDAKGWSQGSFKKSGKGKVVIFGEAAMFSAQLAGPRQSKVGMNDEKAPENYQLLLNIIHWLDGILD